MDQEQARTIIAEWTREHFGKFLNVREIAVVRRATGRVWAGQLYCTSQEGDIHIGQMVISDEGQVLQGIDVDQLINVLVAVRSSNSDTDVREALFGDEADPFADFNDEMNFSDLSDAAPASDDGTLDAALRVTDPDAIQAAVADCLLNGDREQLLKARELLPQLLAYQERRGFVLQQMGELELLLGELEMGVQHLEAAARDYADLANFEGLEQVAAITMQVVGEERYLRSPVRALYDQVRLRLRPLQQMADALFFVGLGDVELSALDEEANAVTIAPGEVLLREGDLANMAFILKAGVLSIRLESPDGGIRIVRSCFPGDFIGENSVLGEYGATCTATVQGETEAQLWQFDGHRLRALASKHPEILQRIESVKTLHQLDSFISMNESTASLNASIRDQLLGCITGIRHVPKDTVLSPAGSVPRGVHLIVHGNISFRPRQGAERIYGADQFAGLRDTIHQLPLDGEFVTAADSLLVFFDPIPLRDLAADAGPEIIAVLEKLE